jgi:hypothetical protein
MTGWVQLETQKNEQKTKMPRFDLSNQCLTRTSHLDKTYLEEDSIIAPSNKVISVSPLHYTSKREFSKYCKGFTSNISSLSCHLIMAKHVEDGSGYRARIEPRQKASKSFEQKMKRIKRMKEIYSSGLNHDQGKINNDNDNVDIDEDSTDEILKWLETIK